MKCEEHVIFKYILTWEMVKLNGLTIGSINVQTCSITFTSCVMCVIFYIKYGFTRVVPEVRRLLL